ncbi:MAG TPA: hypothetical protein VIV12_16415, partial [Streptosporangiaceae bacterium]
MNAVSAWARATHQAMEPWSSGGAYVNFDEEMPRMVATLRARFAKHLNEPAWTGFIDRLSAASPDFA